MNAQARRPRIASTAPRHAAVLTVTLNPAIDLDLTLPELRADRVVRSTAAARQAGGKGVNVARMLTELGIGATALCLAGGPDAEVYRTLLAKARFDVELFGVAAPLRTNLTLRVSARAGAAALYKINQPGGAVTAAEWRRFKQRFAELAQGRTWVVLAGALAPGLPASAYAELAALAHRAGAQVALDCAGEPLRLALRRSPDLVKPNREELTETVGRLAAGERGLWRGMQQLRELGASGTVLVSAGAGACLLMDAHGRWIGTPPRVEPRGTLGAGDSLLAGFLAGMLKRHTPDQALVLGLACGAATTARPDPEFGTRRDVMTLLRKAKVDSVS